MNLGPIKDKSEREKKSISKLLGKQGLYAIVFVCVAAIGITCAVALTGDKQPSGEVERPKSTATVQQTANQTAKPTSDFPPVHSDREACQRKRRCGSIHAQSRQFLKTG